MLFKDDYIKIIIEELQQKTLEELQIIHDFVKGNGTIKQLKDQLTWLSTHNKNYTNKQYYAILECLEIIGA